MSTIQPSNGSEEPKWFSQKGLSLEELKQKDDGSIFLKFDTDKSHTISDDEIYAQGYWGETFQKVKDFLIDKFDVAVHNPVDSDGYFDYRNYREPIIYPKSYEDIPVGSHQNIRDARSCDISTLELTREQLLNLTINKTTIMSPEQKAIVEEVKEKAKDPGLGVRQLHENGYTGKGVHMAIIDQPLGRHQEYEAQIRSHEDINTSDVNGWDSASMHGAAVTSIAVGKSVGVAPDATVDYYSAVNLSNNPKDVEEWKAKIETEIQSNPELKESLESYMTEFLQRNECPSNLPYVEAINKVLDKNETLPPEERVTVISISWGFDRYALGYEELMQAMERAKQQGVFVVSTALDEHYGFETCGANRNPDGDLNDPNNYEAGAFWKDNSEYASQEEKDTFIISTYGS